MQHCESEEVPPSEVKNVVMLIAMPWCSLLNPSIQIGILSEVLRKAGYSCSCRSYMLAFADFLTIRARRDGISFTCQDFLNIGLVNNQLGIGDWIFAIPPFKNRSSDDDECYLKLLRAAKTSENKITLFSWIRDQTQDFIKLCLRDINDSGAQIIGFTTGFSQTVPALTLSKALKKAGSTRYVIFGGADCDGQMGEGLIRAFDWIDIIVRGEGEVVLPAIVGDIVQRRPIQSLPGLCYRHNGSVTILPSANATKTPMNEVPIPNYTEYFNRLLHSPLRGKILPDIEITIESSRGCWWGQKHHCTFCGYNGDNMEFRRKSAERILSELQEQSSRYRTLNFLMTDAILDQSYFAELFPKMKDQECDFRIFYESKAHLSYDKVQKLRDAGVLHLQPGIESLSTPILRSIRKGTTALQNIRILKWCREFGINALWNIIYGFPNEPIEEYSRMVALLPSLSHIQPPSLVRLVLDRFSPYQITPKDFGLEITGPPSYYPYVFQKSPRVIREFSNFAYRFEYRYLDNREPEEYIGEMRAVIEEWTRTFQPERITLRYERGPNFVTIIDERLGLPKGRYTLEGVDATIYLMCDDGATPKTIISRIVNQGQDAPSETYIVDVLKELVLARLLYHEDGRYLSLAIPSSRVHPSILTLMG